MLEELKGKQRDRYQNVKGKNEVEHPLTIYCLANRDKDGIPTKVILMKRDRISYQHVLDIITAKLGYRRLPGNAKKLVCLETEKDITKLEQLQTKDKMMVHSYVCAID